MANLQDQLEMEERMTTKGIEQYRSTIRKAIESGNEDQLSPQHYLMVAAIRPLSDVLKEEIRTATSGKPGRKSKAIEAIKGMDTDVIAFLVAKTILSGISSRRSYTSIARTIANLIEGQSTFDEFKRVNKSSFLSAQKLVNAATTQTHQRNAMQRYAKIAGVEGTKLPSEYKTVLGSYLIKLMAENTGLIEIIDHPKAPSDIVASPMCAMRLKQAHDRGELLKPVFYPMLIEPAKWTTMWNGGYITKPMSLIKTRNKSFLSDPLSLPKKPVLDALNALQSVSWSINQDVLEVIKEMWDNGSTLAKLPSRDPIELPALPNNMVSGDIEAVRAYREAHPKEWKEFKSSRTKAHKNNVRLVSKRIATGSMIEMAEELAGHDQFYFVWQCDWRGRMYPVANSLSPQGSDVSKGLLRFSQGKPLGASGVKWLKIHLANCYGVDKVSIEERIRWTEEHSTLISLCAINPLTYKFWCEADGGGKAWQFLAACFEWERYCREGEGMISHLPISVDGSCNGLQHLSAMIRDSYGATATNLGESPKPQDIYGIVSSNVSTKVSRDAEMGNPFALAWEGKVTRSVVKRNVMTVSYGATKYGMLEQLREDLGKEHDGKVAEWLGIEPGVSMFPYYQYLSSLIADEIGQVVQAAPKVMGWLQAVATIAANNNLPLVWETPSGFKVLQAYYRTHEKRLDTTIGSLRISIMQRYDTLEINTGKSQLAVAPNFVHSMDAAHCQTTVSEMVKQGVTSLAMVHDSYGTHACDMDTLADTLRTTFVKQYAGDTLAAFLNQIAKQLPKGLAEQLPLPPQMGNFDVENVYKSMYFFA